jgi:hypothetical protein
MLRMHAQMDICVALVRVVMMLSIDLYHFADTQTRWNEAELRTYTFANEADETARIYETEESLSARGATADDVRPTSPKVNNPSTRGSNPNEPYTKKN